MTGCADPASQPPSPLPPGIAPRLVTNRWQIVELIHQGQEVQFDAVRPFFVSFNWDGSLFYNFSCRGGYYRVDLTSIHEYQLNRLVGPGVTCTLSMEQEEQYLAVARALQMTQAYSFQSGWLWLTGAETQIALEVAETFPPFPSAERDLILNPWRWTAVNDREGAMNIDTIAPIHDLTVEGQRALDALMETRDYELHDNRLTLHGEGVRIVLEITAPSN
jgi:hypothetical protein